MTFGELYNSGSTGLIRKELFDECLKNLDAAETWYEIIIEKDTCKVNKIENEMIKSHIADLIAQIEKKGHHNRFDWFYADSIETSKMIKVYNPLLCGCSGGEFSVPWIIFTSIKPSDAELEQLKQPAAKSGIKERIACQWNKLKKFYQ